MIRIDINSTVLGEGKTSIAESIEKMLRESRHHVILNHDNQWDTKTLQRHVLELGKGEEAYQVVVISDGSYHEDSIKEIKNQETPPSPYSPTDYLPGAFLEACQALEKMEPSQINRICNAIKILLGET